jgi:hypothetical protein
VVDNDKEAHRVSNSIYQFRRSSSGLEKYMACKAPLCFEILHQLLAGWMEYAQMALLEDEPLLQMPSA